MGRGDGREFHCICAAKEGCSAGTQRPGDNSPYRLRPRQKITQASSICKKRFLIYVETEVKSGFIMAKQVITGTSKRDPQKKHLKKTLKRIFESAKYMIVFNAFRKFITSLGVSL